MSILFILDFYDGCPHSMKNQCDLILNVKAILIQQFMKLQNFKQKFIYVQ